MASGQALLVCLNQDPTCHPEVKGQARALADIELQPHVLALALAGDDTLPFKLPDSLKPPLPVQHLIVLLPLQLGHLLANQVLLCQAARTFHLRQLRHTDRHGPSNRRAATSRRANLPWCAVARPPSCTGSASGRGSRAPAHANRTDARAELPEPPPSQSCVTRRERALSRRRQIFGRSRRGRLPG
eukprot:scaffold167_cov347-Prasinococcus_capsulatus_cf.AAC.13